MSTAHTVNTAAPSSSGVNQADDEDTQLEGWSFPPVPPPKPSRASLGLGLGPGVGVRTQTRSRSGSDANLLSTYSTSPGFWTPPGTSILSAVGTGSGGGLVVSKVEGEAGTRHAVYIVDSEEVSRRLGELLENQNSTLFSSAGHTAEEDDEMEDLESRRRTVVAVTTDADAGREEEERSAHPERIMEEVQEQQRKPQADPVLPPGHGCDDASPEYTCHRQRTSRAVWDLWKPVCEQQSDLPGASEWECGAFEGGVELEGSLKVPVQVVRFVVEPLEVVVQGSFEVVVESAFEVAVQGVGVSSPAGSASVAAAAFAAGVSGCYASVGCRADFDESGFGEEVGAAAEEASSGSSAGLGVECGDVGGVE
ncbi:hypothetical protein H1R20_g10401, partial [Candolleomyces eurysporus]